MFNFEDDVRHIMGAGVWDWGIQCRILMWTTEEFCFTRWYFANERIMYFNYFTENVNFTILIKICCSSSDDNVDHGPVIEVKKDLELPEGATLSDSDSDHKTKDDPHRALDIDLEL